MQQATKQPAVLLVHDYYQVPGGEDLALAAHGHVPAVRETAADGIKVEPLRWYYHCDRLGMIVWQDMVSGGGEYIGNILAGVLPNIGIGVKDNKYNWFSRGEKEWRDDYRRELFEMIDNLMMS